MLKDSINYNTVVLGGLYAVIFFIYDKLSSPLTNIAISIVGLCIVISFIIYGIYTVFGMIVMNLSSFNTVSDEFVKLLDEKMYQKAISSLNKNKKLWLICTILSISFASIAAIILISFYVVNIIKSI